jgi:hypothetical protein
MLPVIRAILNQETPRADSRRRLATDRSRFGRVHPVMIMLYLGLISISCGCTTVNSSLQSVFSGGCLSDAIEAHRNRTCALKAWFRREHNFCDEAYLRDFKAGFIAGYIAIAEGKPGCPPNVPPKEYWSWAYQSADGQARMAAWFRGYPYGVQAARDDGVTGWNHVQIGPEFQRKPLTPSPGTSSVQGSPAVAPNPFPGASGAQDASSPGDWLDPDASIMPLDDLDLPGADSILLSPDQPFPL